MQLSVSITNSKNINNKVDLTIFKNSLKTGTYRFILFYVLIISKEIKQKTLINQINMIICS